VQITDFYGSFGLVTVFAVVLAQQLGAPLPALPVLLLAGAKAIDEPMHGAYALMLAVAASSIGNLVWFCAGRRYGYRVLRLVCRLSLSADSCVRRTETKFERYGLASLVVARFIPGLATLAPPLAGALGIRTAPFLTFSGVGTALWAGSGLVLGLLFYRQIDWLAARLAALGGLAILVVAALLALYVAYRAVDRWRFLRSLRAARIGVHELFDLITKGDQPVILDVRSATHRSLDGRSIPGAQPLDLERLEEALVKIPRHREVVVYCACPNDATAFTTAMLLRKRGIRRVRPLAGGIDAWVDAGLNIERLLPVTAETNPPSRRNAGATRPGHHAS
jgi:membrane protein DedA with SNARE-associated domain/rhodanese-related sulfurtransferase